jgi:transposase
VITNEVYMEIEVLRKHGFSLRRIAMEVGCAVNTVRSHLAAGTKPKYERQKQRIAKLSPYEMYLRERQAVAHPWWIPATVLHREIAAQGYQGGMSQLRSYLRGVRPPCRSSRSFALKRRRVSQCKSIGLNSEKAAIPFTRSAPHSATVGPVTSNSSPT